MYNSIVDFIIGNYRIISAVATLIIFLLFLWYGNKKKGLNFTSNKWELVDLITILTASYSIFTGVVIVVCAGCIEKLNAIQELWLYLIISGGTLVYTCAYGILKNIDSK